MSVNKIYK